MIRHTGRLPGMRSVMVGDVDARVGVYYMANATDAPMDIVDTAIALLRGDPYPVPPRQAIRVEPGMLARYVGVYDMDGDAFTISLEDGQLVLDKNGRKKTPLLAETATRFLIEGNPSSVEFAPVGAGRVERMVVTDADWLVKIAKRRR